MIKKPEHQNKKNCTGRITYFLASFVVPMCLLEHEASGKISKLKKMHSYMYTKHSKKSGGWGVFGFVKVFTQNVMVCVEYIYFRSREKFKNWNRLPLTHMHGGDVWNCLTFAKQLLTWNVENRKYRKILMYSVSLNKPEHQIWNITTPLLLYSSLHFLLVCAY